MPTHRLVLSLALAAAAGCSGDVTGPVSALRFRIEFLSSREIIPGERLAARVEVFNPYPVRVVFRGCPPLLGLARDGAPDVPATRFGCRSDGNEIAAGGSFVDTVAWTGQDVEPDSSADPRYGFPPALTNLPAGPYRIRPVLRHEGRIRARGEPHDVVVLPWAPIRLVNTVGEEGPVDLLIAGRAAVRGLAGGEASAVAVATAGATVAEVRRAGETTALVRSPIVLEDGSPRLLALRRTGGTLELWDVPDGAPAAAPDQAQVRIIHLAASASAVEVRVSPPGGAATAHVVSPFAYGAVSSYLPGSAGPWRVTVVSAGGQDTLLATAAIPMPGGTTPTLFLVNSPAGRMWATIVEPIPADRY
jgi:hypothetical protein